MQSFKTLFNNEEGEKNEKELMKNAEMFLGAEISEEKESSIITPEDEDAYEGTYQDFLKESNHVKKLGEMAMTPHEMSSGMMRDKNAIVAKEAFFSGADDLVIYDEKKKTYTKYKADKKVKGGSLQKGMKVAAAYNHYNQGVDFVEILGVTGTEKKYGEGGVKFKSVKDAMKSIGVKSLKAMEDWQDNSGLEYGHHFYLYCKDLQTGDEGAWYYLYEGRWARGSGAEKLSFVTLKEIR